MKHDTPYHLETIKEHIEMTVRNSKYFNQMLIAVFHDLGKFVTKKGGTFYGHEFVSSMYALVALDNDIKRREIVSNIVYFHMIQHQGISEKVVKREKLTSYELRLLKEFAHIDSISRVVAEDVLTSE